MREKVDVLIWNKLTGRVYKHIRHNRPYLSPKKTSVLTQCYESSIKNKTTSDRYASISLQ